MVTVMVTVFENQLSRLAPTAKQFQEARSVSTMGRMEHHAYRSLRIVWDLFACLEILQIHCWKDMAERAANTG